MEEELLGRQATKVTVLDKSTRFRTQVVLGKVRKGTFLESVWNTLSFNILLADTGNNLRNIDERTLGSRCYHGLLEID